MEALKAFFHDMTQNSIISVSFMFLFPSKSCYAHTSDSSQLSYNV